MSNYDILDRIRLAQDKLDIIDWIDKHKGYNTRTSSIKENSKQNTLTRQQIAKNTRLENLKAQLDVEYVVRLTPLAKTMILRDTGVILLENRRTGITILRLLQKGLYKQDYERVLSEILKLYRKRSLGERIGIAFKKLNLYNLGDQYLSDNDAALAGLYYAFISI